MKYAKLLALVFLMAFTYGNDKSKENADTNTKRVERKMPEKIIESYDCLEGTAADNSVVKALEMAGEYIKGKAAIDSIAVSDSEQTNYGDQYIKEIKKSGELKIDETSRLNKRLETILNALLSKRQNPSKIKYNIYLLDDTTTINAYTFGGKIFVTKAIINKATSEDQLYAIVGHEIGHNEKGHIKSTLQQIKAAEKYFGKYKNLAFMVKQSIGNVFNQKNELEADYYGIGLVYTMGYDPCTFVSFWDTMAKKEGDYDKWEDFMRSHPYSATRSKCLKEHIRTNYKMECK